MTTDTLAIGQVAEAAGIAVSAIRYYEELGLIETPERVGGKRRFGTDAVGRLSFVRRAQDVGFSLQEIRNILDDGTGDWHELVDAKLADLADQRTKLDTMIDMLTEMRECGCQAALDCQFMDDC